MLKYEFCKLSGARFVWIIVALLLFSNIALGFLSIETHDRGFTKTVTELCEEYNKDPAVGYQNIDAQLWSISDVEWEHVRKGDNDYVSRTLDGVHSDRELLVAVLDMQRRNDDFDMGVKQILGQSYRVMTDGRAEGHGMENYAYRYAAHTYQTYQEMKAGTELKIEPFYGWEELLSFRYTDVFLFASLLIFGSVIFLTEKQQGMLPILRAGKRGRAATALSKVGVMCVTSVALTLIFTFSTYVVVFVKSGYSPASAPVQCIEELRFFPYVCSVGQFFGIVLALQLLAALVFSMLLLLLSVLFYQPALYTLTGLLPLVLSFVFESSRKLSNNNLLRFFNFFAVARVIPLGARLRSVNFFGIPIDHIPFAAMVSLPLALLLAALTVFLFARGVRGVHLKHLSALWQKAVAFVKRLTTKRRTVKTKVGRRPHAHSRGLFLWESTKLLRFGGLAILLVLLLALQIGAAFYVKKNATINFDHYYYRHIIEGREGPINEQIAEDIHTQFEEAKTVQSQWDMYDAMYKAKQITRKEYAAFLKKYNAATSDLQMLQTLNKKVSYLEEKYAETGVWGWFADTEGYERYFSGGFILPSLIAVLLIGGYTFVMEYTGRSKSDNFYMLLHATRNGRKKTFGRKMLCAALFSFAVGVVFTAAEFVCFYKIYGFSAFALDAPLFTIELFENLGSSVTIGQYLIFYLAARVLAAVLFGLFCASASCLAKRLLPTFNTLALAAGVPSLLALLGLRPAKYLDVAGWLGVQNMALFSMKTDLFGTDSSVFALFSVFFTVLTLVLFFTARRKFVK